MRRVVDAVQDAWAWFVDLVMVAVLGQAWLLGRQHRRTNRTPREPPLTRPKFVPRVFSPVKHVVGPLTASNEGADVQSSPFKIVSYNLLGSKSLMFDFKVYVLF